MSSSNSNQINLSQSIMSMTNGFLPENYPLEVLPKYFEPWDKIVRNLPELNKAKATTKVIDAMPLLDFNKLGTDAELRRAYSILCLMTNSYVWNNGHIDVPEVLPKCLAQPLWHISEKLGIAPILTHAAVDLYNWRVKDKTQPISIDNLEIIHTITGTYDEQWFYLIMTAIEYEGAKAVCTLPEIFNAIDLTGSDLTGSDLTGSDKLINKMECINETINKICQILYRIKEHCDPSIFYNELRPYLAGWSNNDYLPDGLIYDGIDNKPIKLVGGSAAQSTLFHLFDVLFSIEHHDKYFQQIREYMPKEHRELIQWVQQQPSLKNYVIKLSNDKLMQAYTNCVNSIAHFRKIHLAIVHHYIISFIEKNNYLSGKGTGGTDLKTFLNDSIKETQTTNLEK